MLYEVKGIPTPFDMHIYFPEIRRLSVAVAYMCVASTTFTAQALDPTSKQAEALYAELSTHADFKTADHALNTSYQQLVRTLPADLASKVKEEQRRWLKEMQSAVFNTAPGGRMQIAIRMTQERSLALLGDGKTGGPPASKTASSQTAPAGVDENLREKAKGLELSTSAEALAEFRQKLYAAVERLEKESDAFLGLDELPPVLSARAEALMQACKKYSALSRARTSASDLDRVENENSEKMRLLHALVIRNAPEWKKSEDLELEAYKFLEKKSFKAAAECYRKAIQTLERMELRLGTDMDVYSQFVKKSPPVSLFTKLAEAQFKASDFSGAVETVRMGGAVDKRISKEGSGWAGEAHLIAAKAFLKLKQHAEAEKSAQEAVHLLDALEYGSLREARALLLTIQKARR